MRSATDPRESTPVSRIVEPAAPTWTIESEIVARFEIIHRRRLNPNASLSSRSDLRRRRRPTLVVIVSGHTDPTGPDPLARHEFARPRPTILILNRDDVPDTTRQPRSDDSEDSRHAGRTTDPDSGPDFQHCDHDRIPDRRHFYNYIYIR